MAYQAGAGRGRGGFDADAVDRLRARHGQEVEVKNRNFPGADDSSQTSLLLGNGARKVPRCGKCTRPLDKVALQAQSFICARCEQGTDHRAALQGWHQQQWQQDAAYHNGRRKEVTGSDTTQPPAQSFDISCEAWPQITCEAPTDDTSSKHDNSLSKDTVGRHHETPTGGTSSRKDEALSKGTSIRHHEGPSSAPSHRQYKSHTSDNSYRHDEDYTDISGRQSDDVSDFHSGSHFKGSGGIISDRQFEVPNAGCSSRHLEASSVGSTCKHAEASDEGSSNRELKAVGSTCNHPEASDEVSSNRELKADMPFRGGPRLANGTTGVIRCSRCTRPLDEQESNSESLTCARCLQKLEQELEKESTLAESRGTGSWQSSNRHTWGQGGWRTDSWGGGRWSQY